MPPSDKTIQKRYSHAARHEPMKTVKEHMIGKAKEHSAKHKALKIKLGEGKNIGYSISDHKGKMTKRGLQVKHEGRPMYFEKSTKRGETRLHAK